MVEFDGIYSMLFTGSFEVGRGYVTGIRSRYPNHQEGPKRGWFDVSEVVA
jgi:hypothetical protein